MIILSILIPSIPEHDKLAMKLWDELVRQRNAMYDIHPTLGKIELLWHEAASFLHGGPSIGKHRESLVQSASGKYLNFLDADDNIAPNYIETLVRLCHQDKDIVTFRNLTKTDYYWTVIDMSISFTNQEATPDGIVQRNGWHICPVKSEYAKLYEFQDINYGEDWEWFSKVLTHCKTEAKTNQILHCYNHSSKTSEADKITKHAQSKP